MPLRAPILAPPVVEEPPPLPPPTPAPPLEAPYITWTPTGGDERLLACGGEARILAGVLGLNLPPDSQFESPIAAGDGSVFVGRRRLPRELIFPVEVQARTLMEFEHRRRHLMRDFDPARDGLFRWQLPDGSGRNLRCRLSEMEQEDGGHKGAQVVNRGVWRVTLRGVDPYWYGETRQVQWSAPGAQDFYGGGTGAPPYIISESDTLGMVTIDIDGEVETSPEWGLRGPMTTARLAHPTGGAIDLTPAMPVGRGMLIRTDERLPAHQKVLIGDVVAQPGGGWTLTNTTLAWDRITGQFPTLWPLQPGSQEIEVFAAGTGAASEIRLTYSVRYLTS